jgi:hypothetical protein
MKHLLATAAVLAPAILPCAVQAQERIRPLAEALPFYERYLALPATTRDGFEMRYSLRGRDGAAAPPVALIRDGRRTPLLLGPGGRLTPPADLATLRATQVAVGGPASLTMDLIPILPLSQRIGVSAINNSLGDYGDAVRRAGPLALAAPRLRGISFPGVRSGFAEWPDGRRVALPRDQDGDVVFRPNDRSMRGAVAVILATAPARASFSQ